MTDKVLHASAAAATAAKHRAELPIGNESLERLYSRHHAVLWTLTLFGPIVLTLVLMVVVGTVAGWDYLRQLLLMAVASLWIFGRFIILGGSDPAVASVAGSISSYELFAMVLYLDVAVAMVLAFHLEFLFKVPWIGPKIQLLTLDGRFILNHQPWMRRATFLGLIAFVTFPLAATGSVGGSIFGRLLGLSRGMTFTGIVIGSVIGDGAMLAAADLIGAYLNKDHPVVKYGGMVLVLGIIVFLERRYRAHKHEFARAEVAGTDRPQIVSSERASDE